MVQVKFLLLLISFSLLGCSTNQATDTADATNSSVEQEVITNSDKQALANSANSERAGLDPKLAVFSKFIGTWESVFEWDGDQPKVLDVSKNEVALNGKALRTLHSVNEGMYGGESLIFWDKEQQKIIFYYFTTADFYTSGYIEVVGDNQFVAYEDVVGNENGITKVKSTSTYKDNTIEVSTAYYKKGAWTKPESRTYTASDKAVTFK